MFIKKNSYDNDSLIKEAWNLQLLQKYILKAQNCTLKIPKIFYVDKNILKLEKIDFTYANNMQMEQFGKELGKLHKLKFPTCGLSYDNYIGLSVQKNIVSENWGEFFFFYRLLVQTNLIKDEQIKDYFLEKLLKLQNYIIEFLNSNLDGFSILHGDLWAGNVLFSKKIYLIDPAVYFGDKEVDIAMTEMFGGFSDSFYKEYKKTNPLSKRYEDKKIIYNLYHYLNHYNLFGKSYLEFCKTYIKYIEKLFCN